MQGYTKTRAYGVPRVNHGNGWCLCCHGLVKSRYHPNMKSKDRRAAKRRYKRCERRKWKDLLRTHFVDRNT